MTVLHRYVGKYPYVLMLLSIRVQYYISLGDKIYEFIHSFSDHVQALSVLR